MGSFNTTCFVSQQTISTEDKAVILPILQQSTYNPVELLVPVREGVKEISKYGYSSSSCYATAFWGYAGPMLKGVYSDYGNFQLEKTKDNEQNLRSFLNSLVGKICDVKPGENKYHDHGLSFATIYNPKEKYSFEQLTEVMDKVWELSSKSRLFIRIYNGEPVNMAFAVMHEATANYLIEETNKCKTWDDESLEQKTYFHNYLNKKLSENLSLFSDNKDLRDKFSDRDRLSFYVVNVTGLESFGIGEQEGTHIRNYYPRDDSIMEKLEKYLKNDRKEIEKEFSDKFFENFKNQIDHRYIASGLERLNVKLSPMVYASQDYTNELGNDYLKMVAEVNSRVNEVVKKKMGENEEDYDDEEDQPVPPPKKKKIK